MGKGEEEQNCTERGEKDKTVFELVSLPSICKPECDARCLFTQPGDPKESIKIIIKAWILDT